MVNNLQAINNFANFTENSEKILFIEGAFGVGKSYLIENFRNELLNDAKDVILYDYNHNKQIYYLHEFVYSLSMSCTTLPAIDPRETYLNRNIFLERLNEAIGSNYKLYRQIKEINRLRNVPNFLATGSSADAKALQLQFGIQNEDASLLFRPFELSAESFIIDILQVHCQILSDAASLPQEKKKLLFILDNCDAAAGSINHWLFHHLLQIFEHKAISDFSFFDTSGFLKGVTAADFIEIKIIISGREPLQPSEDYKFTAIKIEPFSKDRIIKAFAASNIDVRANIDLVEKVTQGLPYIIGLVVEAIIMGKGEIRDFQQVERLAAARLMNYLSPEEQDYLRAVAFLQDFDGETLEFMPLVKKDATAAMNFFASCTNLIDKKQSGKLAVKEELKQYITSSVQSESPKVAQSLEAIAYLYSDYDKIMKSFPSEERVFIRMLAYFNSFDKIFAIQSVFGENAATVRKIVDKYPSIFKEDNQIFKVSQTITKAVLELEEASQSELFEATQQKIRASWANYLAKLDKELESADAKLADLLQDAELLEKQDVSLFQEHKKLEAELDITQIKLSDAINLHQKYKMAANMPLLLIPFAIAIASIIEIFAKFTNISQTVLLACAAAGAVFGISRLWVYIKFLRGKGSVKEAAANRKNYEIAKDNLSSNIKKIISDREALSAQLQTAAQLKDKLTRDVQSIKNKIKEPFVREEIG